MIIKSGTKITDGKDEYVIEELIGEGGFGLVYKAKNTTDNLTYAIKTITPYFADDKKLDAFKNEISMATKISSPNVINYKYTHDGSVFADLPPYIIMDYANQGTLTEFINQNRPTNFLENDQLLNIMHQLSTGMKAINNTLVHRDIKPDNILINDSEFLITDFGLSKVAGEKTRTMSFKGYGTLKYIAPEAWGNDNNTIQMDIYSMGIVFFELTTLQHPYKVTNNNDVTLWKDAHLYSSPQNPKIINKNISPTIASLILKMLEKLTSKRFENWDEILSYLQTKGNIKSNSIIDNLISERVQKDAAIQRKITEREIRSKEINDLCKSVNYQFENSIFSPLKKFISDFNSNYPNGDIQISRNNGISNTINSSIVLVSGATISIVLNVVIDEDFIRTTKDEDYGTNFKRKEIKRPMLNKRNVTAWGRVFTHDKKGFNILLLEKKGEIYGDWVILENTVNPMSRMTRPQPFGFTFSEFEKEIQYVSITHIYNSSISQLDMNKFIELIKQYN